jgi:Uma2 family endonuclease
MSSVAQTPIWPNDLAYGRTKASPAVGRMTVADWVALERATDKKHELQRGHFVEMGDGTFEHNAISFDFGRALANALEQASSTCEVLGSDQKVYIRDKDGFYPDMVVVCGEPQIDFEEALTNPVLIVEVLSESTAAKDRGEKFQDYRTIPSLRHYVLVEQTCPFVEHYERQDSGIWSLVAEHGALADTLVLTLGGATAAIPLAKIYRRVPFPAPAATDSEIR